MVDILKRWSIRTIRKDTAAYASLPLSTMSKSKCLTSPLKGRKRNLKTTRPPSQAARSLKAPRHKLIRTAPPMALI
jgi:hypothetical protein